MRIILLLIQKQQDIQQNIIAVMLIAFVFRTAVLWCHGHGFMVGKIA